MRREREVNLEQPAPKSPVGKPSLHDSGLKHTSGEALYVDDFPMPEHYPDYPGWRQVLDYLRAFADHIGVRERVEFGTTVAHVAPAGDLWEVRLAEGEVRRYRGVVCAVGLTMPSWWIVS